MLMSFWGRTVEGFDLIDIQNEVAERFQMPVV